MADPAHMLFQFILFSCNPKRRVRYRGGIVRGTTTTPSASPTTISPG